MRSSLSVQVSLYSLFHEAYDLKRGFIRRGISLRNKSGGIHCLFVVSAVGSAVFLASSPHPSTTRILFIRIGMIYSQWLWPIMLWPSLYLTLAYGSRHLPERADMKEHYLVMSVRAD